MYTQRKLLFFHYLMMCVSFNSVRKYRKYKLNSDISTLFFNMDISVNICHNFELKLSVCDRNIPLEVSMSQNFDIGPSLYIL